MTELERKILHTVAAFRMPASYDTLAAVLVGGGKPFAKELAASGEPHQWLDR